jgi:hypothetical protein
MRRLQRYVALVVVEDSSGRSKILRVIDSIDEEGVYEYLVNEYQDFMLAAVVLTVDEFRRLQSLNPDETLLLSVN